MVVLERPRSAYTPKGSPTKRRAKAAGAPKQPSGALKKKVALEGVYIKACGVVSGVAPEESIACGLARCGELRASVDVGERGAKKLTQLSAFASDERAAKKLRSVSLCFPRLAEVQGGTLKERRVVARLFRAVSCGLAADAGAVLRTLELSGSPRGFDASSVSALARGIAREGCPLRHVAVDHVPLSCGMALELCAALCKSQVSYLALRSCGLDDRSASAVAAVCRAHGARRDEAVWAKNLRKNLAHTFPYAGAGVGQGRKSVIQRHFNADVIEAIFTRKASTL